MMTFSIILSCLTIVSISSYRLFHHKQILKPFNKQTSLQSSSFITKDIDNVMDSRELSPVERLMRAINFYSCAIPVFGAYKLSEFSFDIQRNVLGKEITKEEEEKFYKTLHDWGSEEITEKIKDLKGFYVKTGQIISTRVDIFPEQYTSKLSIMQDSLEPIDASIIKNIIREEILNGAEITELFSEFDDVPLGSASIAQVHKARLKDGRLVAVKVQRPGSESRLLGDIKNLKQFAKIVSESLPIDYYKVFCELEKTLVDELDFFFEAQATQKVAAAVSHQPNNQPVDNPPVVVPLPIPGLVSKHVIIMEYVDGISLSKMAGELTKRGIKPGSIESKLFGNKLLTALTDAFGYMIFGSSIIHGDPHPGNIFVLPNGEICLLDCGQVKELTLEGRLQLAEVVILVNNWEKTNKLVEYYSQRILDLENQIITKSGNEKSNALEKEEEMSLISELKLQQNKLDDLTNTIAQRIKSFGVKFKEGVDDTCAAAVAILLFGSSNTKLPGGYAGEEISKDSPIVQVAEFPQEWVLLGRATVMIRGIANRLGINWALSNRWAIMAQQAIDCADSPSESLPIWSVVDPGTLSKKSSSFRKRRLLELGQGQKPAISGQDDAKDNLFVVNDSGIEFSDVMNGLKEWLSIFKKYLVMTILSTLTRILPPKIKKRLFLIAMTIKNMLTPNSDSSKPTVSKSSTSVTSPTKPSSVVSNAVSISGGATVTIIPMENKLSRLISSVSKTIRDLRGQK